MSGEEFSLRNRIEHVAEFLESEIDERQQALVTSVEENIPDLLIGEFSAPSDALVHLIETASKFNPSETVILLIVENASSNEERVALRFTVTDSGPGLSEQSQQFIRQALSDSGESQAPSASIDSSYITVAKMIATFSDDFTINSRPNCGTVVSFGCVFRTK